jgi:release factor glutamine methyltransferase
MQIIDALQNADVKIAKGGSDTSRLDAEVLLSHLLGVERIELYISRKSSLSKIQVLKYNKLTSRRAKGEPVAYITGLKEFWSRPVKVTRDVLIPRPETELLIEEVLSLHPDKSASIDILDLCTGSGCIPMALSAELPLAKITATDLSKKALKIARSNNPDSVKFFPGDLFDALPNNLKFDIITANPPYIPDGEAHLLQKDIIDYEPRLALLGGERGLDLIARILKKAPEHLADGGRLLLEVGEGQMKDIVCCACDAGFTQTKITKDLSGRERVITLGGRKPNWKSSS